MLVDACEFLRHIKDGLVCLFFATDFHSYILSNYVSISIKTYAALNYSLNVTRLTKFYNLYQFYQPCVPPEGEETKLVTVHCSFVYITVCSLL